MKKIKLILILPFNPVSIRTSVYLRGILLPGIPACQTVVMHGICTLLSIVPAFCQTAAVYDICTSICTSVRQFFQIHAASLISDSR